MGILPNEEINKKQYPGSEAFEKFFQLTQEIKNLVGYEAANEVIRRIIKKHVATQNYAGMQADAEIPRRNFKGAKKLINAQDLLNGEFHFKAST